MGMKKVLRAVLALGTAAAMTAAPMSACAQETDETELLSGLEDVLEESAAVTEGAPYESAITLEFGDGLYDLTQESGTDSSWLKNAAGYVKMVSADDLLKGLLSVSVNDTQLFHVLGCVDMENGMTYISIPEYFDQTIAVSPQSLLDSLQSGSAFTGSDDPGSFQNKIIHMMMNMGMETVEKFKNFFASVPAETWQQELMNYLTPVMSNLQQDTAQEELTVGSLSAEVQTQIFAIPSEKMGDVVKGILDTLSQDQLVESLLQSDAVSSLSNLVSTVSGGSVQLSGQDLLNQLHGALDSAAAADFTGMPGIVVKVQQSDDQNAAGFSAALEAGGAEYDLLTCKAIQDGEEHAFEITPGAMLLSMSSGMEGVSEMSLVGQGSAAGGKLNEEVDLLVNGEAAGKLIISDMDLDVAQNGGMIGTFRIEAGDMSGEVTYGVDESGAQTISYLVNDKVFYNATVYSGLAADDTIEEVDVTNLAPVNSIQDLKAWLETFNAQAAMELFAEAGIPMGEAAQEMPQTEEPAA